MESNLPATQTETALTPAGELDATPPPPPPALRRPLSVAYLPLALVVFTIIAFVMAAWTFLAAG
jgi:hypothetical protein